MIKPSDFRFLDVAAGVSDSFWSDAAQQLFTVTVSEKGRGPITGKLNKHGVLQVCILSTPPFDTKDGKTIFVLGADGQKKLRACPKREALIDALADDLLLFENVCLDATETIRAPYDEIERAVDIVDGLVQHIEYKVREWDQIKIRILKNSQPPELPSGRKLGGRKSIGKK